MVSLLEMYNKFGLVNWICLAKWGKLVGKWPMADCYFKLYKGDNDNTANTISSSTNVDNIETEGTGTVSSIIELVTLMCHIRTDLIICQNS